MTQNTHNLCLGETAILHPNLLVDLAEKICFRISFYMLRNSPQPLR
ncbi:hypothetical protein GQF56_21150 [Rhodobacter sphaeroides]|jgi:hypothetical protein|nr:hypothetical protein [Cereibacter sphaeroides]MVX50336.1 hypothetical protein [Cereibacter sphaeroides]